MRFPFCSLYENPLRGILAIFIPYAKKEATGEAPILRNTTSAVHSLLMQLPDMFHRAWHVTERTERTERIEEVKNYI